MSIRLNRDIAEAPDDALCAALRGDHRGIDRHDAIRALKTRSSQDCFDALEQVLGDEREGADIRFAAALAMANFEPAWVEPALREVILERPDPRVMRGALRTLGRVGSLARADVALEAARQAHGWLREHARFAAMLIGHRHQTRILGLSPALRLSDLAPMSRGGVDIGWTPLDCTRGASVLEKLAGDPIKIGLDASLIYEHRCPEGSRYIALTTDFCWDFAGHAIDTPLVIGVVSSNAALDESLSAGLVILASPDATGCEGKIHIHTSYGQAVYFGEYSEDTFLIGAVDRPGATALELAGKYDGGNIDLHVGHCARRASLKREAYPVT